MGWRTHLEAIETQLSHENDMRSEGEIAERIAAEQAGVLLHARLRAGLGSELTVHLRGGEVVHGTLADTGAGWIGVDNGGGFHVIPLGAVADLQGVAPWSLPLQPGTPALLGMGGVLRQLAAQFSHVRVVSEASCVSGLLTRVGADHLDIIPAGCDIPHTVPFGSLRQVTGLHE